MRALVTGASGGIGSAVAEAFRQGGHGVLRQDLRAPADLRAPTDAADGFVVGNLVDDDVLAELTRRVEQERVDCVVAAHGVAGAVDLRSISPEQTRFVMTANTISVLKLYDAVAPTLRARSGVFVMVASQAGLVGEANNGVYCASKFALVGWARARAPCRRGGCPAIAGAVPGRHRDPPAGRGLCGHGRQCRQDVRGDPRWAGGRDSGRPVGTTRRARRGRRVAGGALDPHLRRRRRHRGRGTALSRPTNQCPLLLSMFTNT